ncbi:GreA/GreB family elongation factor [Croceibacter atlanticus]|jgi:regulator of nucleoside diphosphate kinase|uniref:GreA/GreB family elongation factor n=1 Tax=Croceibacter atlanticus (strain ATCC BAA-628 / JCM 21780 / CIP 108009 / IAM 15332 / KCTC 12090 / HTCC2559) TaxID=216432 RepID=A3UB61_CROAH|nr:GreA/GreB family elongation factor [Croceibacter atlanticus]EAP87047.1 GreA/GreB family elongation factor [Croceibacter atlanticus HTCC2559]
MKYGSLIIEKKEYVLLKRILNISSYAKDFDTQRAIKCLNDNLKNAQILDEEDVPTDVIRFNSNILVEFNENLKKHLHLVIPASKNIKEDKISVITPLGALLFGCAEGDVLHEKLGSGIQHLQIKKVIQDNMQGKIDLVI